MFHIYGQIVIMLTGLMHGHTLVLFTTPETDEILNAIEYYDVSTFYGVSTLYEYLKEYEKTDRVGWRRLKTSSATPIPCTSPPWLTGSAARVAR